MFRTISPMRMLISRKLLLLSLLAAVFSLMAWASGPPDTPIPVTLSPNAWTTVPLPAMPLGIAEHNGVLWVSGADEMLARSDDQGRTWTLVHFNKGGQLLFAVAFAGNDGWAMGSQGRELRSDDDGAHWKQMGDAPANVIRLVASDAQHLMASSSQSFLVSSNGGKSWLAKGESVPKQTPPQLYSVKGVAMPDAEHAGAFLETPSTSPTSRDFQQLFVSTSDGGKTWRAIRFPAGIRISSLDSDANGYMAPGSQHLSDSTESVIFHSADGLHWSTTPNELAVYWCHRSECLLSRRSSWVQWDHGVAAYWTAPSFPMLVNHWAAIPGVLCMVGDGLQCALAHRLAAAPPEPALLPAKGTIPTRIRIGGKLAATNCLRCAPPKYPKQDRTSRISGEVLLHVVIGKSGRMKEVTLLAAPSASLAQAAMQAVRGWVYQPTLLNRHPVEVDTQIIVNYTLSW